MRNINAIAFAVAVSFCRKRHEEIASSREVDPGNVAFALAFPKHRLTTDGGDLDGFGEPFEGEHVFAKGVNVAMSVAGL